MSSDKCRESFEAEYRDCCCDLTRFGDEYRSLPISDKWRAWQAAWNTSREELAKEQARDGIMLVKVVDGGTLEPRKFECEGDDDAE